jgi:LysR family carnitine catabolism transcriptional activator
MRSTLTVHELEAFLLVAQTCNFRRAAEHFHVSQPALTRIIQSAEGKLDARLFDRNTRHVELTPAGKELLPIASRIVAEFHDSLSDLSEFVAGRKGQVTIACLPSAAALLPPIIFEFEKSHPQVTISLAPMSNEFVTEMVENGQADLGISVEPPARQQVRFESFARDDFVLICSLDDPRATRRQIDWRMLAKRPIVASGPASSIRPIVQRALAEAGLSLTPKYEVTNVSVVGAMVAAGLGVAPIPRLALRLMDTAGLAAPKLVGPVVHREIGILTRSGRSLSAATMAFFETLRRSVRAG